MPPLVPHLTVKGGGKALDFYEAAFGAVLKRKVMADDGERVLHAVINIHGGQVYICDEFPEFGPNGTPAPATLGGTPVALQLHFTSARDADAGFDRAIQAGAEMVVAMKDAPWGDRYGRIRDPFGHIWSLSGPLGKHQDTE
ncbi:PhnB protein [Rhodoligotrophos appendicifer]|uniref:VOC family protein n=1 Tax=Rhodoligotrophos appendicifer TaxID=987056 RepID=UPI00147882F8|nr:VOC family protein [Rhodoligotrophos appendicifer]